MKTRRKPSVWETPEIQRLLKQSIGTPFELTLAQARAIVREGSGLSPNLPEGADYVRALRSGLGKSLVHRQTSPRG